MASISKRISQSFSAMKEMVGLGEEQTSRTIPMNPRELKELRMDPRVKDNIVRTSKYNVFTFLPINLF